MKKFILLIAFLLASIGFINAQCEPISNAQLPFVEDFESYNGVCFNATGTTPNCWHTYAQSASAIYTPHVTTNTNSSCGYSYPHSGTQALTFTGGSSYGGNNTYAVLPAFERPLNELILSFWYKCESSTEGTLTVGYITGEQNDLSSYTVIATMTNTTNITKQIVDLSSVPNTATYIVFRWYYASTSWYSCCIDDVCVSDGTPVFSPASGNYIGEVEVAISGDVDNYYYTTDGSTPDNTSNLYGAPLNITTTTTLKAIGYINGIATPITEATYTIIDYDQEFLSILQLRNECLNEYENIFLRCNLTVAYQSPDKSMLFVTDNGDDYLLVNCNGLITETLNPGDTFFGLLGNWTNLYNEYHSLSLLSDIMDSPHLPYSAATINAKLNTITEPCAASDIYLNGSLVKLTNVKFNGADFTTNNNPQVTWNASPFYLYDAFNVLDNSFSQCDNGEVTGLLLYYNGHTVIAPRSANDFKLILPSTFALSSTDDFNSVCMTATNASIDNKVITMSSNASVTLPTLDLSNSKSDLSFFATVADGEYLNISINGNIIYALQGPYNSEFRLNLDDYMIDSCVISISNTSGTAIINNPCVEASAGGFINEYIIADGNNTNNYIPIYGLYMDNKMATQSIYPASEIAYMINTNISNLQYYLTSAATDISYSATVKILMTTTTENDLYNGFIATNGHTEVFNGQLSVVNKTMSIELQNPFFYTGGNLLVTFIVTNTGNYSSRSFYGNTYSNASRYVSTSANLPNISTGGTIQNFLPKTKFTCEAISNCAIPDNLNASVISQTTANFSWTGAGDYAQIRYKTNDGYYTETGHIENIYTVYPMSVFTKGTTYTWQLRFYCEAVDEYSPWIDGNSFTLWDDCLAPINTTAIVTNDNLVTVNWSVPEDINFPPAIGLITDDFENGFNNDIFTYENNNSYPWTITSTRAHSGNYSIKSTNNGVGGNEFGFTITQDIPADTEISFYSYTSSETCCDFLKFYIDGVSQSGISTAASWTLHTFPVTAGTHTFKWAYIKDASVNSGDDCVYIDDITMPVNTTNAYFSIVKNNSTEVGMLPASLTKNEYSYSFFEGELGDNCYAVRTVCNTGNESELSEDACVNINDCHTPAVLVPVNITDISADITWTREASEIGYYIEVLYNNQVVSSEYLEYSQIENDGNDNFTYSIENLDSNSEYTVTLQADCGNGEISNGISSTTFITLCGIIRNLPYTEGFEDYTGTTYSNAGIVPNCWYAYSSKLGWPHICSSGDYYYPHSGTNVLTFYGGNSYGGNYNYAVLPAFERPLNELILSFWYRYESSSYGTLTVGYITGEQNDLSGYTVIATMTGTTTITKQIVDLSSVPNTATYIVFRWYYAGNYGCGIDDIEVSLNCNLFTPVMPAFADNEQCGGSYTLPTSETTDNWVWTNSTNDTIAIATASDTYTVVATNIEGCTATDNINVTINPVPEIAVSDASACLSYELPVVMMGSDTWAWTNANDENVLTVTETGIYTVVATNNFNCTATESITVTINELPEIPANVTDLTFCTNSSVELPVVENGVWTDESNNTVIEANANGYYTLTIIDPVTTCQNTATIGVMETTLPTIAPFSQYEQCGGSYELPTNTNTDTWVWTNESNETVTEATESGVYTVVATNEFGCTETETITVIINEIPEIPANIANMAFCNGDLTALTLPTVANGIWTNEDNDPVTEASVVGTYTLTITNPTTLCENTATIEVTEANLPVISVSDATACDSYTLPTSETSDTWEWANENNETVTDVTESGVYTVLATNEFGCTATENITVTINQSVTNEITETACGSFEWNGTTYTNSGDYSETFTAENGCDSVVTLHLTINEIVTNEITETACGSFEWNGTTYDASGDYDQTFTAENGCDSVVTLHLTINEIVTNEITETACGSFEWNGTTYTETGDYTETFTAENGCDSVVTLHLTINEIVTNEITETACGSFEWNGTTYDASGDYSETFTAENGCDSVVTLHLTINELPTVEITQEGEILTATAGMETYAWNTNETTESITISATGTYSVTVTNAAGCENTADIEVTEIPTTGINEIAVSKIAVYPNPNNGEFTINLSGIDNAISYQVIDAKGAIVKEAKVNSNEEFVSIQAKAGNYTIKVISDSKVFVEQIIVQ